ncbi:hypothetical protein OG589_42945 [Sphaerisporangium sp. NBC_01403]|uniref:hypothetical protein n=1 Tax=Sphaerisporangium sp. NBC_01403 TaxID=2903599 RepID=UPI0032435EA7
MTRRMVMVAARAATMAGLGGGRAVAASATTRPPAGFLLYEAKDARTMADEVCDLPRVRG